MMTTIKYMQTSENLVDQFSQESRKGLNVENINPYGT